MRIGDRQFVVIGENIHTTRVVLLKGKRVVATPEKGEALRYIDSHGQPALLPIPEKLKTTQDYQEGRVKHVKVALHAAMAGADEGMEYLRFLVGRQEGVGADFLDLNVDEVSLRYEEQRQAMQWLVRAVKEMTPLPLAVDSSRVETLRAGLEVMEERRCLLNSASLERLEAVDLAREFGAELVISAAGEKGMPEGTEGRLENAGRMMEAALSKGFAPGQLYLDPLVFPISVDISFGNHCLEAIRQLRARYGPELHITGGFSNVSFGLPCRQIVNEVFLLQAMEAGADSGIVDPVSSPLSRVAALDRNSKPYLLTEAMLLGQDTNCKNFLRAYRKGELEV
ncbi:MAG: dihydropteroate synthase [Candidatus Handelsmanbacteria bacterium]|nr:dihydropteroate synthase [Candidatus Handelsmanbacteria bacterium]